ncbi:TrmB family transcriptional regulator, partial [Candidatus Woesearchaeota archaeon]|nr:TrmB family transcriptional regulator [Candidatus Woesearchaeota archaeon]
MIEEILHQIGLTEGEIKVYLSLLELGSTSTGKIIKKSHISGSKVYEVLDRLSSKGLVTSVVKNGVKYFEATTPEKILSYLR